MGPLLNSQLGIQGLRDRALVFVDNTYAGVLQRNVDGSSGSVPVSTNKSQATLNILVENQGRINFGSHLLDRKGITDGVLLDGQFQYNWTMFTLPMDDLTKKGIPFSHTVDRDTQVPSLYRGSFHISRQKGVLDTFLSFPGWTKGFVLVNGFNLGRYWTIGPQQTLYVPAPVLKEGLNEIILFELSSPAEHLSVVSTAYPDLG